MENTNDKQIYTRSIKLGKAWCNTIFFIGFIIYLFPFLFIVSVFLIPFLTAKFINKKLNNKKLKVTTAELTFTLLYTIAITLAVLFIIGFFIDKLFIDDFLTSKIMLIIAIATPGYFYFKACEKIYHLLEKKENNHKEPKNMPNDIDDLFKLNSTGIDELTYSIDIDKLSIYLKDAPKQKLEKLYSHLKIENLKEKVEDAYDNDISDKLLESIAKDINKDIFTIRTFKKAHLKTEPILEELKQTTIKLVDDNYDIKKYLKLLQKIKAHSNHLTLKRVNELKKYISDIFEEYDPLDSTDLSSEQRRELLLL